MGRILSVPLATLLLAALLACGAAPAQPPAGPGGPPERVGDGGQGRPNPGLPLEATPTVTPTPPLPLTPTPAAPPAAKPQSTSSSAPAYTIDQLMVPSTSDHMVPLHDNLTPTWYREAGCYDISGSFISQQDQTADHLTLRYLRAPEDSAVGVKVWWNNTLIAYAKIPAGREVENAKIPLNMPIAQGERAHFHTQIYTEKEGAQYEMEFAGTLASHHQVLRFMDDGVVYRLHNCAELQSSGKNKPQPTTTFATLDLNLSAK